MPRNYANPLIIKKLVDEIEAPENKARREQSLKQFEIFMDRMEPFVSRYLEIFYNENDIKSLPLISSINLARRIVKQEASIYKCAPTRTFTGVSEEQKAVLEQVYKDMCFDQMMQKSNEYFKLQNQNNIQIVIRDQKLAMRVLLNHHFDVVPELESPEYADAYILSGLNKSFMLPALESSNDDGTQSMSDGYNEVIADMDDYQGVKMYVLWSDIFNFLFTESGQVVGGYTPNPIGIKPFVDISPAKDFEFFVRQGQSVTDFTVQFNAALTDMSQIVRLQGFAQAYMIAEQDMMPQSMKIGPAICVKLPMNADKPEVRPEFGFAQPNADLEGSMKYLESLMALFLSSRGLDPKTISANGDAHQYTSGMERLLAMVEKFEATRSDFNIYMNAEKQCFKIIKAYLNTYSGTDVLKYKIAPLGEDADVEVMYEEPEMIETEMDKINLLKEKLDLGLMSKVEAIMEDREIPKEEAEKVAQEIDAEMQMSIPSNSLTISSPANSDNATGEIIS